MNKKPLLQGWRIRVAAGVLAGAILISAVMLFSSRPDQVAITPAEPPSASGPLSGTFMPWVDGSTLIFVPGAAGADNNGVEGSWITLNPISNYQYSLCVQAGACQELTVPEALAGYTDPVLEDASLIFPSREGEAAAAAAAEYCEWIQASVNRARVEALTDLQDERRRMLVALQMATNGLVGQMTSLQSQILDIKRQIDYLVDHPDECPRRTWEYLGCVFGISPHHLSQAQQAQIDALKATYDDLQARQQALLDHLQNLGTALRQLEDEERALGESIDLHCDVEAPRPQPQFVSTAPYHNGPGPVDLSSPQVLQSAQFCQGNQGYETLDFQLAEGKLESVEGQGDTSCQIVNANRIVCYGPSNANSQASIALSGMQMQVQCQAGYALGDGGCSLDPHSGSIPGLAEWKLNENGLIEPINPFQTLPSGGIVGPDMPGTSNLHGVIVNLSLPLNSEVGNLVNNGELNTADFDRELKRIREFAEALEAGIDSGTTANDSSSGPEEGSFIPLVPCPQGYYFDQGLQGCASLDEPGSECLDGYHFSAELLGCQADAPDANYPGCPAGILLDAASGQCDLTSKLLSPTSMLVYEPVQISLPDCSAGPGGGSGPDGTGPGGGCPPGQTYTCEPDCGCAPG